MNWWFNRRPKTETERIQERLDELKAIVLQNHKQHTEQLDRMERGVDNNAGMLRDMDKRLRRFIWEWRSSFRTKLLITFIIIFVLIGFWSLFIM